MCRPSLLKKGAGDCEAPGFRISQRWAKFCPSISHRETSSKHHQQQKDNVDKSLLRTRTQMRVSTRLDGVWTWFGLIFVGVRLHLLALFCSLLGLFSLPFPALHFLPELVLFGDSHMQGFILFLFCFFLPCSADHTRDWSPCQVVFKEKSERA